MNPNQLSPEMLQQAQAAMAQMTPEMWQQFMQMNHAQAPAQVQTPFPAAPQMPQALPQGGANLLHMLQSSQGNGALFGTAFNTSFREFLTSLQATFDEYTDDISFALTIVETKIADEPLALVESWQKAMTKLSELSGIPVPFFKARTPERAAAFIEHWPSLSKTFAHIPLAQIWNDEHLYDEDRQAIWDHMYQLELIASVIEKFDGTQMGAIEDLAKRYVGKLQAQGQTGQQMDLQSLALDVMKEVKSDPSLKEAFGDDVGDEGDFDPEALQGMLDGPMGAMLAQMGGGGGDGQGGGFDPAQLMSLMSAFGK